MFFTMFNARLDGIVMNLFGNKKAAKNDDFRKYFELQKSGYFFLLRITNKAEW